MCSTRADPKVARGGRSLTQPCQPPDCRKGRRLSRFLSDGLLVPSPGARAGSLSLQVWACTRRCCLRCSSLRCDPLVSFECSLIKLSLERPYAHTAHAHGWSRAALCFCCAAHTTHDNHTPRLTIGTRRTPVGTQSPHTFTMQQPQDKQDIAQKKTQVDTLDLIF